MSEEPVMPSAFFVPTLPVTLSTGPWTMTFGAAYGFLLTGKRSLLLDASTVSFLDSILVNLRFVMRSGPRFARQPRTKRDGRPELKGIVRARLKIAMKCRSQRGDINVVPDDARAIGDDLVERAPLELEQAAL